MDTNCAPLIVNCFYFDIKEISCCLFLMVLKLMSLKLLTQSLEFLYDLVRIDNPYFQDIVSQTYPAE